MPRSSGGVYSLYTPGNPVVPNTVISTTWANNTLTDLATAMTDSLSRSGDGAMLAPLELIDGSASAPGVTWSTETSSGWYRKASNSFSFSISGAEKLNIAPSAAYFNNAGGDFSYSVQNGSASITSVMATDNANSRVTFGATTNHGLALLTNGAARLTITNAGAVAVPGALTADTVAATTSLTVAGVSVRDATNLFTSGTVPAARLPGTYSGFANPTASIGLTVVNGVATTAMRSDAAPALSQAITPTWTGLHTFTNPTAGVLFSSATATGFQMNQTGAAVDNRLWDQLASAATMSFRAVNDAQSVANAYLTVSRSGATIGNVNFPSGTLQYGGTEVGYRDIPITGFTTSRNVTAADRNRTLEFTGGGGQTLTTTNITANGGVITVINSGSAALTLAISGGGTQVWYNGSGTLAFGSRTLAVGGVATIITPGNSNAYVTGTGVS